MGTRLGIELSPSACRIVEVDARRALRHHARDTRVRSFAVLPASGPETRAKLESLRNRNAAVVVWNVPSDLRQVVVTGGSYESMRAEALAALAEAGLHTRGVWADIAPASRPASRSARRPVLVALASASEMSAALRPIIDAGIRLRTVSTPAMALGSLARLRRGFSVPDAIEVYLALEEEVTCIALVRGGVLIAARDLAWGYIDETDPHRLPMQREAMTARLADAITDFIAGIGGSPADIGQVCVCGGLPELRSMTVPLMERLDVEVEPLDSLFSIDAAKLPEPVNEFRERGAELRLAWAVAADWPSPINLLRVRKRQTSKTMLARAAVVTGVAAGLVLGWRIERSQWWRSTETKSAARTATNVPPPARGPARALSPPQVVASKPPVVPAPVVAARLPASATVATKAPVAPPPSAVASNPPVVRPPSVIVSRRPVVTPSAPTIVSRPAVAPPPAVAASKPPVVAPLAAVASRPPVAPPPSAAAGRPAIAPTAPVAANRPPVPPPPRQLAAAPARAQTAPTLAPAAGVSAPPREDRLRPAPTAPTVRAQAERPGAAPLEVRQEPAPARATPALPADMPLPFEAALGTILYSPDRKLAIIDGRIVGPGDEVRGARVIDITPDTVMLRDGQGRLRKLQLGTGVR